MVVEVHSSQGIGGDGILVSVKGEALYLDLGGRPLIALMGCHWDCEKHEYYHWAENHPAKLLLRLLHGKSASYTMDGIKELARHRGPLTMTAADLPSLVTFEDAGRPASVQKVEPDDLSASFGPGVRWKQMTIEVTDEPLTFGLAKKLPWITGEYQFFRVPGAHYQFHGALKNTEITVNNHTFKQ